jgi:hypothetical protein
MASEWSVLALEPAANTEKSAADNSELIIDRWRWLERNTCGGRRAPGTGQLLRDPAAGKSATRQPARPDAGCPRVPAGARGCRRVPAGAGGSRFVWLTAAEGRHTIVGLQFRLASRVRQRRPRRGGFVECVANIGRKGLFGAKKTTENW